MKKMYPTFIDESAKKLNHMIVSGGRTGLQIEISPTDLQEHDEWTFSTYCERYRLSDDPYIMKGSFFNGKIFAGYRHSPITGDLHRIKSVNAGISDLKIREGVFYDR